VRHHQHQTRPAFKGFNLKRCGRSPNGTSEICGGTPSSAATIVTSRSAAFGPRTGPSPIIIGRHALVTSDPRRTNSTVDKPGTFTLTFTPEDGSEPIVHDASRSPRVVRVMGMYNCQKVDPGFGRSSFNMGSATDRITRLPSTKNTIRRATTACSRRVRAPLRGNT